MTQLKFLVQVFFPKIANFFRLSLLDEEAGTFFLDLVKKSVEEREKSGTRYNDFIDQVLDVFKGAGNKCMLTFTEQKYIENPTLISTQFYRQRSSRAKKSI